MQDFTFHAPSSVSDAVSALQAADDGKLLSGGQSLLPLMKLEMAMPSDVVSLGGVAELKGIEHQGNTVVIGAGELHASVARSDLVRQHIPALAELASHIGDAQVRNRGTLGGSLAHADPAADYPAAVLGLGATIHTDRRAIAAADFFRGLFETALEDDEVIVRVAFPIPQRASYAKFPHPASLYAVVGVFVADFGGGDVRVSVTGTAEKVFRLDSFEQALASSLSADALEAADVPTESLSEDPEYGLDYRAHLVRVMARRAVAKL